MDTKDSVKTWEWKKNSWLHSEYNSSSKCKYTARHPFTARHPSTSSIEHQYDPHPSAEITRRKCYLSWGLRWDRSSVCLNHKELEEQIGRNRCLQFSKHKWPCLLPRAMFLCMKGIEGYFIPPLPVFAGATSKAPHLSHCWSWVQLVGLNWNANHIVRMKTSDTSLASVEETRREC